LRLPVKEAPVIDAMKTLSAQYPRYGYRRIRIFLRRQGRALGVHRAHRLWRQAGMQLPRRSPRRRIATSRPRPLPPANANFAWAHDFVFDTTAAGQQFKCLTVVDEFTHGCLPLEWFRSRAEARVVIETWRRHYNAVRPHSNINYVSTPSGRPLQCRPSEERCNPVLGPGSEVTIATALTCTMASWVSTECPRWPSRRFLTVWSPK
jgi:transposase InsO family protein